jgi:hypothetical protein
VLILRVARAPRRKFHSFLPSRALKDVLGLQARGALHGARVERLEDDAGHELFVVTRGAETRNLPGREAVDAWLTCLERGALPVGAEPLEV